MKPDNAAVYTDLNGLSALKRLARNHSSAAIRGAARQFESQFVQIMLQTMRSATSGSSLFNGDQERMFRDLHDKELAQKIAGSGQIGLADILARQLEAMQQPRTGATDTKPHAQGLPLHGARGSARSLPLRKPGRAWPLPPPRQGLPLAKPPMHLHKSTSVQQASSPHGSGQHLSPQEFIDKMRPHAEQAAAELGVPADVLLAQSALESGWGKHVLSSPTGTSHNLFGIKAHGLWHGDHVSTHTLEYDGGAPRRQTARFRAYSSYAESFRDYAAFIRGNPRYAQALKHSHDPARYLAALQEAGYATDPAYAAKVQKLMRHQAIAGTTLVATR